MEKIKFPFDVNAFFKKCLKHGHLPKNDFEKQAVLIKILEDFEDRIYDESEVNEIIKKYFDDYATIRRELVNFGYMQRDARSGKYKVIKRDLTKEDIRKNTLLRRHAEPYKIL